MPVLLAQLFRSLAGLGLLLLVARTDLVIQDLLPRLLNLMDLMLRLLEIVFLPVSNHWLLVMSALLGHFETRLIFLILIVREMSKLVLLHRHHGCSLCLWAGFPQLFAALTSFSGSTGLVCDHGAVPCRPKVSNLFVNRCTNYLHLNAELLGFDKLRTD